MSGPEAKGGATGSRGSNRRASQEERDRPGKETVRAQRNHAQAFRSSATGQPNVHSVVTDSTMTMAMMKGISLVMRQNFPEYFEVPAAIFLR